MSKFSKFSLFLLALVFILYFVFILMGGSANDDARFDSDRIDPDQLGNMNDQMQEVVVEKSFINGEHTLTGQLTVPTPCHTIEQEVIIRESYPEQVQIDFKIVDSGGVCAQVLVDQEFEVSFQASELATVQAFLDGVPIKFVLK